MILIRIQEYHRLAKQYHPDKNPGNEDKVSCCDFILINALHNLTYISLRTCTHSVSPMERNWYSYACTHAHTHTHTHTHIHTHTQFKDIQFAYEVLSDPQRRERYDNFGMSAVKEDGGGAGPSKGVP